MWVHALDEYTVDGKASSEFLGPDPNPYDIYRVLESLPPRERPVFIFDEFDRISDENCFATMADTIKYLADYSSKSTVIIVGVADNVSELFGGHPSVQRNVQQIRMPRMSQDELGAIFNRRMPLLGMHFHPRVMDLIIELSQGLPTYTHLLGQNAALAAIGRKSLEVTASDFNACIEVCISEADETVREGYLKAVRSTKPGNQYRQALLACARAKTNEKGYFNAADVRSPFSKTMNRDVDIPHFARHLKEFCDDDRGPALVKTGRARSYEYRFVDPLLRPFVILRGISDKMIEP
jgi:hypothetical protein